MLCVQECSIDRKMEGNLEVCIMVEISLIVPVYNVEPYLYRCLDSIDNQTFKDVEIILVDDGSEDGSGGICDAFAKNRNNVIVIHKQNAGLGMARNSGLDVAKGKYVVFIDSDDYIENNFIEMLYNDIISHQADTCIGGYKRITGKLEQIIRNPYEGRLYLGDNVKTDILSKMFGRDGDDSDYLEMSVWKVLFSNNIIKENHIRFPSEKVFISEDIIFDTDYYCYSNAVYMSKCTGYCYCDNEGSLTTRYRPDRLEKHLILYNELKKRSEILGIDNLTNQRIMTNVVSIARYCIKHEVKYNKRLIAIYNIRAICSNEEVQIILSNYNQYKVKNQSKVINYLMKKKLLIMLYIVSKFKLLIGA